MKPAISAVILAAGRGKRMNGECPKVLLPIEGIPMIQRVVNALVHPLINRKIIVVGELKYQMQQILPSSIEFAIQEQPLGTADAFKQALNLMNDDEVSFVLPSDLPFLEQKIISQIIEFYLKEPNKALVIGMMMNNPQGFGRIYEKENSIAIVEEKDANEEELEIQTINTGIYLFPNQLVRPLMPMITTNNIAGEYYITDLVYLLAKRKEIRLLILPEDFRLKGVNNKQALEDLLEEKKNTEAQSLIEKGKTLLF